VDVNDGITTVCKYVAGQVWETRGGWKSRIVWVARNGVRMYVIHRPEEIGESGPIFHRQADGRAFSELSVDEPPVYDEHPADLVRQLA
jgi:hypothetical protein